MLRTRRIQLLSTLVLGLGSLAVSLSAAAYLHGHTALQRLTRRIATRLGLELEVTRARPVDFGVWALEGGRVGTASHLEPLVSGASGRWSEGPATGSVLELHQADLTLAAVPGGLDGRWSPPTAGAGGSVRMSDLRVRARVGNWRLSLGQASGSLGLNARTGGRATFEAGTLNGCPVTPPIRVDATLVGGPVSGSGLVELPWVPIDALRLPEPWPSNADGRATAVCEHDEQGWRFRVAMQDLELQQWSIALAAAPLSGSVRRVVLEGSWARAAGSPAIACSAVIVNLDGNDLAPWTRLVPLGGCVNLDLIEVSWRGPVLERVRLRGEWTGIDLAELAEMSGIPAAVGRLDVTIRDLQIEAGTIVAADLDFVARAPADGLATIDTCAVVHAADAWLGVEIPNLPPQAELEFGRLAMRLEIAGPHCRLYAMPDAGRGEILTVRLLGQTVAVIRAPDDGLQVDDLWFAGSAGRPIWGAFAGASARSEGD